MARLSYEPIIKEVVVFFPLISVCAVQVTGWSRNAQGFLQLLSQRTIAHKLNKLTNTNRLAILNEGL